MDDQDTLDLKQAADLLKISLSTAQQAAETGELPGCKVGRSWVFLRSALLEYLREQTQIQQRERRARSGVEQELNERGSMHGRRRRRRGPPPDLAPYLPEPSGESTAA
jgi:excisionase family DNA binding protein